MLFRNLNQIQLRENNEFSFPYVLLDSFGISTKTIQLSTYLEFKREIYPRDSDCRISYRWADVAAMDEDKVVCVKDIWRKQKWQRSPGSEYAVKVKGYKYFHKRVKWFSVQKRSNNMRPDNNELGMAI